MEYFLYKEFEENFLNSGVNKYCHNLFNDPQINLIFERDLKENKVYIYLRTKYPKLSVLSEEGEKTLTHLLSEQDVFTDYLTSDDYLDIYGVFNPEKVNTILFLKIEEILWGEIVIFLCQLKDYTTNIINNKIDYVIEMFLDQVDQKTIINYLLDIKKIVEKIDL